MKKEYNTKKQNTNESSQLKLVKIVRTLGFVSLTAQIVSVYSIFTNAFEGIFNILALIIKFNIATILDPLYIGGITIIISIIGFLLSGQLTDEETRKGFKYKGRFIALGTSALLLETITLLLINLM